MLEPIGQRRNDVLVGLACSVIANVMGCGKKDKTPFSPADFMMFAEKTDHDVVVEESVDPKEQSALIKAVIFGNMKK